MSNFTLEINRDGDHAVIAIAGELDLRTRDRLRVAAIDLLQEVERVVADLSQVTFVDSSGLSALIAVRQEATRLARDFRIRSATGPAARVLTLTGLTEWLSGEAPVT
jgi:anti-sigma B factor antagonist